MVFLLFTSNWYNLSCSTRAYTRFELIHAMVKTVVNDSVDNKLLDVHRTTVDSKVTTKKMQQTLPFTNFVCVFLIQFPTTAKSCSQHQQQRQRQVVVAYDTRTHTLTHKSHRARKRPAKEAKGKNYTHDSPRSYVRNKIWLGIIWVKIFPTLFSLILQYIHTYTCCIFVYSLKRQLHANHRRYVNVSRFQLKKWATRASVTRDFCAFGEREKHCPTLLNPSDFLKCQNFLHYTGCHWLGKNKIAVECRRIYCFGWIYLYIALKMHFRCCLGAASHQVSLGI